MTLSTLYMGSYGTRVCQGHAGALKSAVPQSFLDLKSRQKNDLNLKEGSCSMTCFGLIQVVPFILGAIPT